EPYTHESDEEVVVVLEGELDLWVADEHHRLGAGDTITYSSRLPHRNVNRGATPARVLFCITPPSF
ncbi:MAG: cupin domain-containing protein, partial [Candidatus Limnocylindrales bacterium]